MSTVDEPKSSRYSRRGFLKRAGAGAGAVALSGGVGATRAPRAVAARSATVATSSTASSPAGNVPSMHCVSSLREHIFQPSRQR